MCHRLVVLLLGGVILLGVAAVTELYLLKILVLVLAIRLNSGELQMIVMLLDLMLLNMMILLLVLLVDNDAGLEIFLIQFYYDLSRVG